ncbi:MAG: hypothetical protein HOH19_02560 [Kordiimonadaceae bacterium]|nr:hypothetical protein [Kordiimonadaceae bacterium]MBT6031430.1 hypothetical protein [Kordiimonadaceae bacterium]
METVFVHIIQNAIDSNLDEKASPIAVSLSHDENYVIIKFEDNAIGISKDFIRDELLGHFVP